MQVDKPEITEITRQLEIRVTESYPRIIRREGGMEVK
jgi:hypothetical protein